MPPACHQEVPRDFFTRALAKKEKSVLVFSLMGLLSVFSQNPLLWLRLRHRQPTHAPLTFGSQKTKEQPLEILESLQLEQEFAVFILNDDYTPMDFVIQILKAYFAKNQLAAELLTQKIHCEGEALAGVYSHQIAETKIEQVHTLARSLGHPLQCHLKPA